MNQSLSSEFLALRIAVLTVSDTRTVENDRSGDVLVEWIRSAGHELAERKIEKDDLRSLRAVFREWVANPKVDVVLSTGGTGLTRRDITPEALEPLITKKIAGFGELFRMLSYEEIGTSTIQSRVEAALCEDTFVFMLPGSPNACRTAVEKILTQQLDLRHRPCNFVELLPRIRIDSSS